MDGTTIPKSNNDWFVSATDTILVVISPHADRMTTRTVPRPEGDLTLPPDGDGPTTTPGVGRRPDVDIMHHDHELEARTDGDAR
jgi:hypothetical protein